jgi:hypothetical protein
LDALDNQLFLRDNPRGAGTRDLWYHEGGCAAWLKVTRSTVTHAVLGAELVMGAQAAPQPAANVAPKLTAKPITAAAKPAVKPAVKAAPKPAAKPAASPRTPKKDCLTCALTDAG